MNEQDYKVGWRRAWLIMLRQCLRELGHDDSDAEKARWVVEREETVLMLRSVCERHGDNDWPDDLHLTDVIEKHLGRHLDG